MNTTSLKSGDIVLVNKKGRVFYAHFVRRVSLLAKGGQGDLIIRPITPNISYRACTAREITGVWHANKATATKHTREEVHA